MAQQRSDRFLEGRILKPTEEGPPWKVPCIATVEGPGYRIVEDWLVKFTLNGVKVGDDRTNEEGKTSFDVVISKPGTYRVEIETNDSNGRRISYGRDITVEKKDEKDEHPYLFVRALRRADHYDLTIQAKVVTTKVLKRLGIEHEEEHVHPAHKPVQIEIHDPRLPTPLHITAEHGVGYYTGLPLPTTEIQVVVTGAGQVESVTLYP